MTLPSFLDNVQTPRKGPLDVAASLPSPSPSSSHVPVRSHWSPLACSSSCFYTRSKGPLLGEASSPFRGWCLCTTSHHVLPALWALCWVRRPSPLSSLKEDRAIGLLVSQYLSRSSDLAKGSIFSDLTFQLCQAQIQGTEVPASAVQWGQQNQANELTVRNFNLC